MARTFDFVDEKGVWSEEHQQLLQYFMQNTTEKIFRRMDLMDIKSSRLRSTIHGVVYNNANGQEGLVRFYYLNLHRFLELGVGKFASDADLGHEGVKVFNLTIPEIPKGGLAPLDPTFKGTTSRGKKVGPTGQMRDKRTGKLTPVERAEFHKARPFMMNTIRQEMARIAERFATQLCYTHTLYMSQGIMRVMDGTADMDEQWRRNMGLIEEMRVEWGALKIH